MKTDKSTALLIGGFGFVGYHLAKRLLASGSSVLIFGHEPRGGHFEDLRRANKDTLEFCFGDVISGRELHMLAHERTDIDRVFYLADMKSTTATRDRAAGALLAHNYDCVIAALDFAETLQEMRGELRPPVLFVYMSSGEVYAGSFGDGVANEHTPCLVDPGKKRDLYPVSKIAGEMMLRHGGWSFKHSIVRLQSPYGPYMGSGTLFGTIAHAVSSGNVDSFTVGGELDVRPFLYADDMAEGIEAVANRGQNGATYNLAGRQTSVMEAARLFGAEFGVRVSGSGIGPGEHRNVSTLRIEADTGWKPRTSIEAGARATARWFKNQIAIERSMDGLVGKDHEKTQ